MELFLLSLVYTILTHQYQLIDCAIDIRVHERDWKRALATGNAG